MKKILPVLFVLSILAFQCLAMGEPPQPVPVTEVSAPTVAFTGVIGGAGSGNGQFLYPVSVSAGSPSSIVSNIIVSDSGT